MSASDTIELSPIMRLRVARENCGEFAEDKTGTLTDFVDVPAVEGSIEFELTQEMLDPETVQQNIDGYPDQVLGIKGNSLSFTMNLAPTGNPAGSGETPTTGALGKILHTVLGGEQIADGATVTGTPDHVSFDIENAATKGYKAGGAVVISDGTNFEMREIEDEASDTLTMKLSGTQVLTSGSDEVFGTSTYYLTQNPSSSLQFIVEGAEHEDRFVLMGDQLESLELETPIGEMPRITFNFQGASWEKAADVAGASNLSGTDIGTSTFTNYEPINAEGDLRIPTVAAQELSGTRVHASEISISPNIQYTPVKSPAGKETIFRYRRTRNKPVVETQFTNFYEDVSWIDARTNATKKAIFYQLGNQSGSILMISVPTNQVTNITKADADGIRSQQITLQAQRDEDVPNDSDDLAKSPFRIHF